jgi:hypothetical protein
MLAYWAGPLGLGGRKPGELWTLPALPVMQVLGQRLRWPGTFSLALSREVGAFLKLSLGFPRL